MKQEATQPSALGSSQRIALVVAVVGLGCLSPSSAAPGRAVPERLPSLMLWAWERPEDLRRLEPGIGVAFLAQTITISGDRFSLQPRRQPLRVAATTLVMAVTRIEAAPSTPVSLHQAALGDLASLISRTARLPQVVGIQVDFDATATERAFYRTLLGEVRARIGAAMPLSMTALASWCAGDAWLRDLPVDEAVPMLFRMGPSNEAFRAIGLDRDAAAPECRKAIGVSLDEPMPLRADGRRVYVFSHTAWTDQAVAAARRQQHP